jgi:hypothetical protein
MINQPERVDLKHDSVHPPTGPRSYLMHSPITCVSPMRVRSLAALTKARESLASAHRARAAGEDLSSRAHTQTVSCGAVGGDASNGSQAANSSSNLGTLASLRHRRHWPPPARLRMPCLGQRGRGVRRHSSHFFFRILCLQNPVAVATQGSRRHYLLFTPCSHMYLPHRSLPHLQKKLFSKELEQMRVGMQPGQRPLRPCLHLAPTRPLARRHGDLGRHAGRKKRG